MTHLEILIWIQEHVTTIRESNDGSYTITYFGDNKIYFGECEASGDSLLDIVSKINGVNTI
jgi:hypothetical protein